MRAKAELLLRKKRELVQNNFEKKLLHYKNNPIDYFSERLNIDKKTIDWSLLPEYENHSWDGTPNPFMAILQALVASKWVGVESATGTGKTFNAALIALWFLECFENSIVVTTAPKEAQLSLHIWKEIGKLQKVFCKGESLKLLLRMNPGKDDWIAVGFVAGIKANEESSTRAQGFHAEHMLIILEETPGIPAQVINAFQNTCTAPHNLILALGNPDHQLDNLHKFCSMSNVEHVRISAYDHPNVVLDNPSFIPGAASTMGIKRIEERYGKKNPMALSRTRGLSPSSGIDSVIKFEWVEKAVNKYVYMLDENEEINRNNILGVDCIGVDVANSEFGDKASICIGRGNVVLSIEDFQCEDTNQLGHKLYLLAKEQLININNIGVDGVGVGAGTVNTLLEYGASKNAVNIQSGSSQNPYITGIEEFNNLRSQMWWLLREDLRLGNIALPRDDELIADIIAPKYRIDNKRIIVESKEEIKKRLGRSPNKGDSLVYWNYKRYLNSVSESIILVGNNPNKISTKGY